MAELRNEAIPTPETYLKDPSRSPSNILTLLDIKGNLMIYRDLYSFLKSARESLTLRQNKAKKIVGLYKGITLFV